MTLGTFCYRDRSFINRMGERGGGINLKVTRSILKKISDIVTLGTFCYRDQSFINRIGGGGGGGGGDIVTLGTFCYRDQSFINRMGGGLVIFSRKKRY